MYEAVARIYLEMMKDNNGAQKAIDAAPTGIEDVYDDDRNPDDPNEALKLYWPSTHLWSDFVDLQARIDVNRAIEMIQGIRDEEIRAIEQVMFASSLLHVPLWRGTSPLVARRSSR